MAASLALASCADENIGFENQALQDGSMVAVEDLNLVFNRGGEEGSRAVWNENEDGSLSFAWEDKNDKVGLVYVGQGGKLGVTNYEFTLDSLKLAEGYKVKSGASFVTGYYGVGEDKTPAQHLAWVNTSYQTSGNADFTELPLSSKYAKFKTVNDAIMKGYYMTYSPYNEDYKESGTAIPVTGVDRISVTPTQSNLQALGDATFSYSTPQEVAAGKQVTYFGLNPLTNAFVISIKNEAEYTSAKNLKSVVLRTHGDDKFVISGTLVDPAVSPSKTNMVAGKKTSTLFVDYKDGKVLTLAAGKKAKAEGVADADTETLKVYFPVLPTSFATQKIDVILIGQDNKACVLEVALPGSNIQAGKYYPFEVAVTKDTKFDQAFVTDEETFKTVLNNAVAAEGTTTINLLGNITVDVLTTSGAILKSNVVVNGTGLTLKNSTVTLANTNNPEQVEGALTINAPLTLENSSILGKVTVDDLTIKGNVNVGQYIDATNHYYGQMIINGDATIEKNAVLSAPYAFKQGVTVSDGATLTVKKDGKYENGNFYDSALGSYPYYKSDLFINGTMTIEEGATFEDKGDTQVGATGKLVINGAATNYNWLKVNGGTVEIAGTLTNEVQAEGYEVSNKTGNGNVMVSSGNLTLKSTGKIYNKYSLNCMGTFTNDGVFYDYVGSVYGGNPFTSNGKYACYVDAQGRLEEAVSQLNIYAAGKYQEIILQAGTYTLNVIDAEQAATLNIVNEGNVTIDEEEDFEPVTINSLTAAESKLTINANINVAGAAVATTAVTPMTIAEDAELEFKNNITVKVNGAVVNEGTFNLLNASSPNIPAKVYCKSTDVTTGTWTNYPIVQANGAFWN